MDLGDSIYVLPISYIAGNYRVRIVPFLVSELDLCQTWVDVVDPAMDAAIEVVDVGETFFL